MDHRRAEDVARLDEAETHVPRHVHIPSVRRLDHLIEGPLHVRLRVERLHPRFRIIAGDVEVGRVLFLDLGGIGQHDPQQVARRRRTEDRPIKPLSRQRGQVAAMVDVGVAEDDGVDLVRMEGEVAVALPGLLAAALVQSAVEEDFVVADLQQVHRTGHAAGRPPEGECRLGRGRRV